ncbi:MAG TPA: hypothetical protein DCW42_01640 [Bacteroidetes bacterium]|nr:hypothetical protein [Bacteroidota bacterium]
MTNEELDRVLALSSVSIVAPAGHGKTEMIADIVNYSSDKQLILTHTNAGVEALVKRMKKRGVNANKYSIMTIAAFCIKWCHSYPNTGSFVEYSSLYEKLDMTLYYNKLYAGASKILANQWARSVIMVTYSGVIVDEYQDCTQDQHELFLTINKTLPVRVLGDPLQGIFYWAGQLVNWNTLEFPRVDIETKPWRWHSTNPSLGNALSLIRAQLEPFLEGKSAHVNIPAIDCIEIIPPDIFNCYKLLKKLSGYESVVYITKYERQQIKFCNSMAGIFQNDETQDCKILFEFAKRLDEDDNIKRALAILDFAKECATSVGVETASYKRNLEKGTWNFSKVKQHIELGLLLAVVCEMKNYRSIANALNWFLKQSCFKFYRKELYFEMLRSIKFAIENQTSIFEASIHIRRDIKFQKRYSQFNHLVTRTVLSKGLEFDCVIIDMKEQFHAKDFYVALTRAKKKVYIISNSREFLFQQ